jgi:hypothetical protein
VQIFWDGGSTISLLYSPGEWGVSHFVYSKLNAVLSTHRTRGKKREQEEKKKRKGEARDLVETQYSSGGRGMPRQASTLPAPPPPECGEMAEVVEADPDANADAEAEAEEQEERWARLLPELLSDVVRRVEASGGERWPARKDVVSCACVCRRWREAAVAVVRPPAESGKITFPSSLKQVRTRAAVCARRSRAGQ